MKNFYGPTVESLQWAAFYSVLHIIADHVITLRLVPKAILSKKSLQDRNYLTEKIISSLNGIMVGGGGIYLVLIKQVFKGSFGIFEYYPLSLNWIFSSYVGYSIYDMAVMVISRDWDPLMWFHHLIGSLGAYLTMVLKSAAYFPAVFTITELTVVPTNWVWYLRQMESDKHSIHYRIAHFTRSFSFLLLRSFIAPVCMWYAYQQMDESSSKVSQLIYRMSQLPWIVSAGVIFNVCALGGMNLWWTVLMGKGILLKSKKTKQVKAKTH